MCNKMHIQPWTTANYNFGTNPTEQCNDKIKKVLHIQLHNCEDHSNWDKCLPTVLFTLFNYANTTTGMIPSKLLPGRDLQLPRDWCRPHTEQNIQPTEEREATAWSHQTRYQQQWYPDLRMQDPTLVVGHLVGQYIIMLKARCGHNFVNTLCVKKY